MCFGAPLPFAFISNLGLSIPSCSNHKTQLVELTVFLQTLNRPCNLLYSFLITDLALQVKGRGNCPKQS